LLAANAPLVRSAGITTGVLAQREKLVFEWAGQHGVPVSFVLAGGYSGRKLSRAQLVDLHRLTVQEAVSAERSDFG
jgi:acetoin utilization deacetylase AcuC-like enzyme